MTEHIPAQDGSLTELIGPSNRLLSERTIREHDHDWQDGLARELEPYKEPDDWITGDEEMTGAQESYLQTLAEEAHESVEPDLTKAEAPKELIV